MSLEFYAGAVFIIGVGLIGSVGGGPGPVAPSDEARGTLEPQAGQGSSMRLLQGLSPMLAVAGSLPADEGWLGV